MSNLAHKILLLLDRPYFCGIGSIVFPEERPPERIFLSVTILFEKGIAIVNRMHTLRFVVKILILHNLCNLDLCHKICALTEQNDTINKYWRNITPTRFNNIYFSCMFKHAANVTFAFLGPSELSRPLDLHTWICAAYVMLCYANHNRKALPTSD